MIGSRTQGVVLRAAHPTRRRRLSAGALRQAEHQQQQALVGLHQLSRTCLQRQRAVAFVAQADDLRAGLLPGSSGERRYGKRASEE